MKTIFLATILVIITLILSSCGMGDSPENTANQFMGHLVNEDYEAAKAISTANTHQMIGLLQAAKSMGKDENSQKETVVFDCSCEQEGETATCSCCEDGNLEECTSLNVVKKEGKWLADMKKEGGLN